LRRTRPRGYLLGTSPNVGRDSDRALAFVGAAGYEIATVLDQRCARPEPLE
jgi:hypothetical protein